jgi:hypothetical protein
MVLITVSMVLIDSLMVTFLAMNRNVHCDIYKILSLQHILSQFNLDQGFSNFGTHTTSGTPATAQRYTGLVRKIEGRKRIPSINAVT